MVNVTEKSYGRQNEIYLQHQVDISKIHRDALRTKYEANNAQDLTK